VRKGVASPDPDPEPVAIAVRAFTQPARIVAPRRGRKRGKQRRKRKAPETATWPEYVLIFDTETTTDPTQRLLFGVARLGRWIARQDGSGYRLETLEEAILVADDLRDRDPAGYAVLERYARTQAADVVPGESRVLQIYSRDAFVRELLLKEGYRGRALIVGFNLPFDLSRLAVDWAPARARDRRRTFGGGFSFVVSAAWDKRTHRWIERPADPRVQIKHIDRNRAFIEFASSVVPEFRVPGDEESGSFRGFFLDLKTLAFALADKSMSLKTACETFQVVHGKTATERHGIITSEYLGYCRRDVKASAELLEKLRDELDRHPLGLAPWDVHSPASLAKATLRQMGITSMRRRSQ
jgi:hypothetical protein